MVGHARDSWWADADGREGCAQARRGGGAACRGAGVRVEYAGAGDPVPSGDWAGWGSDGVSVGVGKEALAAGAGAAGDGGADADDAAVARLPKRRLSRG